MIHTLHWDVVTKNSETVLLLWPAPIGHDLCFSSGGFDDFADSNEEWDADFERLINRLLEKLGEFGKTLVENEIKLAQTFFQQLFRKKNRPLELGEQLILSTRYDCPDFKIYFGPYSLKTGREHPLIIVNLPNMDKIDDIVNHVAQGLKTAQTQLNWSKIDDI